MADKVVVTKSKLDELAQHINTKAGTTGAKTIAQMQAAVDGITGGAAPVTYSQVNPVAAAYLADVTYSPSDYSTSEIESYASQTTTYRKDQPSGVDVAVKAGDLLATDALDGVLRKTVAEGTETLYNLAPMAEGADYVVQQAGIVSGSGHLTPTGALRMIYAPPCLNVRDLGGWPCDGGTIKYGKLFRGGALSMRAHDVLVEQCGVRVDLDLRGSDEAGITESPLGSDVSYVCPADIVWYSLADKDTWREILRCIFDNVALGRAVYYHCAAGADRTGTVSCILELLLGVAQSNVDKDYELTSFAGDGYLRKRSYATGNNTAGANWVGLINAIAALDGTTMRDKAVTFVASLGFTAAEINAFRAAMIDGTPETLTPSIDAYTVTTTLTNVTSDNSAASATEYQPYTAKITPASGYAISAVKITMGGVDITDKVWDGVETLLSRKVTLNLAHCTSNTRRKSVIDGQSYAATLSADDGYTLDGASVTITMGGVDVSTYYKEGVIAIPSVTGNLVIEVTAVESAAAYTNLLDTTSADWLTNKRYNSSGSIVDAAGWDVSNYVACTPGDVLRYKNMDITADVAGAYNGRLVLFDSGKVYISAINAHNETKYFTTDAAGITTVDLSSYPASYLDRMAYVRFVCAQEAYSNPIATINEEIT